MANKVELKSCPFCGSIAYAIFNPLKWGRDRKRQGQYKVECAYRHEGCPVNLRSHYHDTADAAALEWNTRV